MFTMKAKTMFYLMVVSVIITLMGMAVMRFSGPAARGSNAVTTDQKLKALEKTTADSPEMHKFLQRERAAQ